MRIRIKKNIFNETFLPLLEDNEHDTILLLGGGGSGKSFFSFQRAVIRCLQDKRKYLITRKSAVDLERSCWADVMNTLEFFQIKEFLSINKTLKTIDFPNGSQMLFMGLDDEAKVKSIPNITDIIIEECNEINFDTFSQLKQRMRGNGVLRNQLVLMTNPISKVNWVYKHFYENGCKEPNCVLHHSTYKDNRFLNQKTIEALEDYKRTNPYYYNVYCLGEWGSLSKQIFTNWRVEKLDIEELSKKGYEHLIGMDFGYQLDPSVILQSLLDEENKRIYVYDEFYASGLLNDALASVLLGKGLAKSVIIADSAEMKSIDEIKKLGVRKIKPATKGAGSVLQGIQKLQQYEIIVDESCFNTIQELENYAWKRDKRSGEYIQEPEDKWNHTLDSLRYSLECQKARLKTLPSDSF